MSTFCSMVKLCINRDNLLVPLILAANQISVYQMRKCFKLFILAQFLSVRVLASKQLFIHPCLSLSSPCSPLFLLHSSPFLLSLPLISPPIIATSLLPSSPLSYSVPPPLLSLSLLLPPFSCFLNYPLSSLLLTSIFTHHFLPSCTFLVLFFSPYSAITIPLFLLSISPFHFYSLLFFYWFLSKLLPFQGECERGTEWKIDWGKRGHKFELPNKYLGKSVREEL